MLARGVTSTSRIASRDSTETIAKPSRCSRTAVSNSPRPVAAPNSSAGADDRRNARRNVFGVEARTDLTVDQQSVAPKHDGSVNAFALPDGSDQITNARHVLSSLPAQSRGEARDRA